MKVHHVLGGSFIVAGIAAAIIEACGPVVTPAAQDPCAAMSYQPAACQAAINAHGYFWYGTWYPMNYMYGFGYYGQQYNTYVIAHPGYVVSPSYGSGYTRSSFSGGGSDAATSGGTVRGGFGGTGAAHASGGGGGGE